MALPTTWKSVAAGDTHQYLDQMRLASEQMTEATSGMASGVGAYLDEVQQQNQEQAELEMSQLPDHATREAYLQDLQQSDHFFSVDVPQLEKKLETYQKQDQADLIYESTMKADKDRRTVATKMKELEPLAGTPEYSVKLNEMMEWLKYNDINDKEKKFETEATKILQAEDVQKLVTPELLNQVGIDIHAPRSFTIDNYNKTHRELTNKLTQIHPYASRIEIEKMATKAITNSAWGVAFSRMRSHQDKKTIGGKERDNINTELANAMASGDPAQKRTAIGKASHYLTAHYDEMTADQRQMFVAPLMDALNTMELLNPKDPTKRVENLGEWYYTKYDNAAPTPAQQRTFKNDLADIYRTQFPGLRQDIIDQHIEQQISKSGRSDWMIENKLPDLKTAIDRENVRAQRQVDLDAAAAQQSADAAKELHRLNMELSKPKNRIGAGNWATTKLLAEMRENFLEAAKTAKDKSQYSWKRWQTFENNITKAAGILNERMDGIFRDPKTDKSLLRTPAQETTYRLALYRFITTALKHDPGEGEGTWSDIWNNTDYLVIPRLDPNNAANDLSEAALLDEFLIYLPRDTDRPQGSGTTGYTLEDLAENKKRFYEFNDKTEDYKALNPFKKGGDKGGYPEFDPTTIAGLQVNPDSLNEATKITNVRQHMKMSGYNPQETPVPNKKDYKRYGKTEGEKRFTIDLLEWYRIVRERTSLIDAETEQPSG